MDLFMWDYYVGIPTSFVPQCENDVTMVFIRGRKIVVVSSEVYIIGPSQWPVSNKM